MKRDNEFWSHRRSVLRGLAAGLTVAVFAAATPIADAAPSITGKWRGNGVMNLKSGGKETVRCSVTYGRIAGQDFSVKARCASGAGKVDQTGTLTRVSKNRYVGTLINKTYSITAKVTVNVNGANQNVSISSSEGTANLKLARR